MSLELTPRRMKSPRATRRLLVGGAIAVLIVGLAAFPGTAAIVSQSPRPVYKPPQSYYLALGDSMTYGFQPTKAKPGARPSDFKTGYVDLFAARLRKLSPKIDVVNYGCPGESTVTFTRGGWRCDGFKLHNTFRGPQLKAAASFLRAHPRQVSPITLTLWATWLRCRRKASKREARSRRSLRASSPSFSNFGLPRRPLRSS
jgi:hypothetical protein